MTNRKEPSFETTIEGPSGKADFKVTKTVIKSGVNMGGQIPLGNLTARAYTRKMQSSLLKHIRQAVLRVNGN